MHVISVTEITETFLFSYFNISAMMIYLYSSIAKFLSLMMTSA